MDDTEAFVRECIETNNLLRFYTWRAWRRLAAEVKREANYECQYCKAKGKLRRAEMVHHIYELKQYPQYAMSKTVVINGEVKQNLVALCNECHEKAHNRFVFDTNKQKEKFTNLERW